MNDKAIAATRAVVQRQLEAAEQELKQARRDLVVAEGNAEEWRRRVALCEYAGDAALAREGFHRAGEWDERVTEIRSAIERRERVAAELRDALARTSGASREPEG